MAPDITFSTFPGKIIYLHDIAFSDALGEGGFAFVTMGTWNNQTVAVKQFFPGTKISEFRHEITMLEGLDHPR